MNFLLTTPRILIVYTLISWMDLAFKCWWIDEESDGNCPTAAFLLPGNVALLLLSSSKNWIIQPEIACAVCLSLNCIERIERFYLMMRWRSSEQKCRRRWQSGAVRQVRWDFATERKLLMRLQWWGNVLSDRLWRDIWMITGMLLAMANDQLT